jgi:hypothetical protein
VGDVISFLERPVIIEVLYCCSGGHRALCFITIWQYTQVLSLARISRSSCPEIPYVLDMVLDDPARHPSWLSSRRAKVAVPFG